MPTCSAYREFRSECSLEERRPHAEDDAMGIGLLAIEGDDDVGVLFNVEDLGIGTAICVKTASDQRKVIAYNATGPLGVVAVLAMVDESLRCRTG